MLNIVHNSTVIASITLLSQFEIFDRTSNLVHKNDISSKYIFTFFFCNFKYFIFKPVIINII